MITTLIKGLGSVAAPYMLWIKIAGSIALLGCSFWAGVRWESAESNAALLAIEKANTEALQQAAERNKKLLDDQLKAKQVIEKELINATAKANRANRSARDRINKAFSQLDECRVTVERERLWRSLHGGGDSGAVSESGATPDGGDGASGGCSEADLYTNHADVVRQFRECGVRLTALQQWARVAMETCNAPPSDVGQ